MPEPVGPVTRMRPLGEGMDGGRQPQFLETHDAGGDLPDGAGHGPALAKEVRPEPAHALPLEGQVDFVVFFEPFHLGFGQYAVSQPLHVFWPESRDLDGVQGPVDANLRRGSGRQVEVGRALLHHDFQQLVDVEFRKFLF